MYIQGFVIPVPKTGEQAYHDMAAMAAPLFREHGARTVVECWGDDVPHGELTDFHRTVEATDEETVVFAWIAWPDRAAADRAEDAMRGDERMVPPDPMPFDGKRMIYGGFAPILDTGEAGAPGYVDGFVAAVPTGGRQAYADFVHATAAIIRELGATRVVEGWGDKVPDGTHTDFKRAVQAKEDETVCFSWIEWPDKQSRDRGMAAMMEDPRMRDMPMPFDGKRMIYGGFRPILTA